MVQTDKEEDEHAEDDSDDEENDYDELSLLFHQ